MNKLLTLENLYSTISITHAVIVYGEKGLGKRSCIQYFLSSNKDVVKIAPKYENQYQLEPIIHMLKLDTNILSLNSDLSFEERIKKEFLLFCKKKPIILYIEQFNTLDSQTASFLLETANVLLSRFNDYKTFIIFELNTDENQTQLASFYELPPIHTDFICFSRLSISELKDYFFSVLGDIDITNENLSYILDSSFGNIMYLNIAINYLKGEKYIRLENERYICDKLPSGILADVLKEFILQRYNRLDNTLKEVLAKSSIIGNVFDSDLVSKPFQIINADDILQKIEKISQLITRPDSKLYSFENEDTYSLIKSNVSPQLQKEWHNVLANYYEKLLKREQQRKGQKSINREIETLFPIAKHYKYAQNYNAAIIYYIELASKYKILSDYSHELNTIQEIRYMLEYIDLDHLHLDSLEYDMLRAEADCYKNMGDFPSANRIYCECLNYFDIDEISETKIDILYQQAYSLYMDGEIENSLRILYKIKKYFEENGICNYLYIKLISLLASVYDATGDYVKQKKYYLQALNFYKDYEFEQEYYVLLRMASMVFGEEIAIKMEETAADFFRNKNLIRYLAEALHNIATDYLYIGELTNVEVPINESINLFNSFASLAVHCPMNTKGILMMVLNKDYKVATKIFEDALQLKMEPYSEIAIRTNILNCLNMLEESAAALKQLVRIDKLIELQKNEHIPIYVIYQNLNWAFYYFHLEKYDECLKKITICSKLDYMEPRYKYVYKALEYQTKTFLGLKTRNTAGTAPMKIHEYCVNNGFYFTTLRFYESI